MTRITLVLNLEPISPSKENEQLPRDTVSTLFTDLDIVTFIFMIERFLLFTVFVCVWFFFIKRYRRGWI